MLQCTTIIFFFSHLVLPWRNIWRECNPSIRSCNFYLFHFWRNIGSWFDIKNCFEERKNLWLLLRWSSNFCHMHFYLNIGASKTIIITINIHHWWIYTFCVTSCMGPKKQGFWPRINCSQMKLLDFKSPSGYSSSKSANFGLSKWIFYVKNHLNLSKKNFHWRISI